MEEGELEPEEGEVSDQGEEIKVSSAPSVPTAARTESSRAYADSSESLSRRPSLWAGSERPPLLGQAPASFSSDALSSGMRGRGMRVCYALIAYTVRVRTCRYKRAYTHAHAHTQSHTHQHTHPYSYIPTHTLEYRLPLLARAHLRQHVQGKHNAHMPPFKLSRTGNCIFCALASVHTHCIPL